MATEEANSNADNSSDNINRAEPFPINSSEADNNTSQAPRNPRRKKKKITVHIIQEKSNQPIIANWISGISAVISLALGVITLWLYFEAKRATKITQDALAHQITKDSNDNVNRARKDTPDSISEAKNLGRDTIFINKQKQGIDTQIAAFKENRIQFEKQNRAFIQAREFYVVEFPNRRIGIQFTIADIGRQPAKILTGFYDGFLDTATYTTYSEVMSAFKKNIAPVRKKNPTSLENSFITDISPQKKTMVYDNEIDTTNFKKLKDGYWNYYMFGEIAYIDLISKKKKKYVFACEIDGKHPNLYVMINNRNYPE